MKNTYSVWCGIIYYGEFEAANEEEARLIAANYDEDEAFDLNCCLVNPEQDK